MRRFGFGKKKEETPTPPAQQTPPPMANNPYAAPPGGGRGGGGGGGYGGAGSGGYGGGGGGYGGVRGGKEEDDPNRGALFGNRGKSPAPSSTPSYSSAAPSYSSGGYNSGGGGGGAGGYGGGYGGYGGAKGNNDDPNRDKLFGDRPRPPPSGGPGGGYGSASGGGYGGGPQGGGYGSDAPRREGLSPEEEEEEDVDAIKQQIRFTKQESVNSTRRALAAAAAAEESGRSTLTRLGEQGERLTNTKKNLDLAHNQNRKADETTRELKTLNRSMFAVHVGNPFNSSKRAQQEEDAIVARHQDEMAERERTRQAGFEQRRIVDEGLGARGGYGGGARRGGYGGNNMSMAERSKYQFEADESDDEKEKEIESNLDQIGNVVGRLRNLAVATNKEVDFQNRQIDLLTTQTDNVSVGIARNTHKLSTIK